MVFLKINLLLAALGLGCCSQAFSSCSERGLLSNCGAGASVVEHGPRAHRLPEPWHLGSMVAARRLVWA